MRTYFAVIQNGSIKRTGSLPASMSAATQAIHAGETAVAISGLYKPRDLTVDKKGVVRRVSDRVSVLHVG
jgi:hypothetical protein